MSYPRNADGSLSYSLKGAREYALETGDHALNMAVSQCASARDKASVFKSKLKGSGTRIARLEEQIAKEREIQQGGEGELNTLKAGARMAVDAFKAYVDENHA